MGVCFLFGFFLHRGGQVMVVRDLELIANGLIAYMAL